MPEILYVGISLKDNPVVKEKKKKNIENVFAGAHGYTDGLGSNMWRRKVRRSRVRWTSQSPKGTTTTNRTLETYTALRSNGGNNGNDDVTPRETTHPTTGSNAHKYTTQGKFHDLTLQRKEMMILH